MNSVISSPSLGGEAPPASGLIGEQAGPVGSRHLELRIKRVRHDYVRVEISLIDEAILPMMGRFS